MPCFSIAEGKVKGKREKGEELESGGELRYP